MNKKSILFIFLSMIIELSLAQQITGIVKDLENNEALIGVNIITTNNTGTATDLNGKFTITLEEGINKLTFKYLGYKTISKEILAKKINNRQVEIFLESTSEKLNTVVISAGKFNQRIEETTISMEVIKPSLIENKNTTNIKSAMEQIPGLNITDGQANIRGGSGWSYGTGTRVLVLVDDMPLISGDAGQVQWNLIATENINQVEVIKGAASALYGSSALNGVVNIRTSYPKNSEIDKNTLPGFTKLNMNFGLIDFPRRDELNWNGEKRRAFKGLEFLQSYKMKKLDLSIGGNLFLDDGYRQGEATDRKRFNINSLFKSDKIKGLSYGLNANFLFQNTASVIIWDSYDRAYIPLNGELTNTNGNTYNVDPYATYIIGNNRHTLRTRFLKVINDNSTIGDTINNVNRSKSYYSDYKWQKNLEKINLSYTMGTTNEIIFANSKIFQGSNFRRNHSLYTQIDKKIGKLNISSGGRYEYFSLNSETKHIINGDSINNFSVGRPVFRAGINYEISPSTFLRSSWGQGYRFPSMAELFVTTNASGIEIYANPELKPERGWSSEIALKQKLKISKWSGFIDIAAFIMRYHDMMEFTFGQWGDPTTMPLYGLGFKSVNIGKTQISGVELSFNGQGKINNDLSINLIGGYTYMDPIALEPNKVYTESIGPLVINGEEIGPELTYNNSSSDPSILKYRYQHIAKIDAEFLYQNFLFGTSLRFNDFMRNIDKIFTDEWINQELIPGINEAREKYLDGDFIIDLRIGYNIDKNSRISLIINNLLNEEYMSRPADMRPPRTIACQLSLKI
jgi:iron complex outermembrane receptor protein